MKKTAILLLLFFVMAIGVFAQATDLIVLLDTSASMSNSYRETSDYLTGPFLREFLRLGDTFHLISFSGSPRLEISRRVEGLGDIQSVIARILLMYPLDPQSDLAAALAFAEEFTATLSPDKPKKIILLSDGDAMDTQKLVSDASARLGNPRTELQYISVPVSGNGPSSGRAQPQTAVQQTQVPQTPPQQQTSSQATQSQQSAQTSAQSQTSGPSTTSQVSASGTTAGTSPSASGTSPVSETAVSVVSGSAPQSGTSASSSQQITAPADSALQQTTAQPETSLQEGGITQPETSSQGGSQTAASPQTGTSQPGTPSQAGTSPQQSGTQSGSPFQQSGAAAGQGTSPSPAAENQATVRGFAFSAETLPLPMLIGIGVLALLGLGLIIFFAARNLHSSPNRAIARAAAPQGTRGPELMGSYAETQKNQSRPPLEHPQKQSKPLPKDKIYTFDENDGPIMLNLFVEDQNTAIGRRNVHAVKPGYNFTIGGGKSDFLIFLVPFPPHIADLLWDGRNCTLTTRKPEFFPDLLSQSVPNCIGKTIRVVSDRDYEIFMRIERFQDPLKVLNKLLNSISTPGEIKSSNPPKG